jgi:hypothetical protein
LVGTDLSSDGSLLSLSISPDLHELARREADDRTDHAGVLLE